MPRFYFDLCLDSDFNRDEIGSEVGSLRAAEIELMRTAADLARDRLLKMQSAAPDEIRVELSDEHRQPILTVTLSVQVERTGPMTPRFGGSCMSVDQLATAAEYRRQAQEIRTIVERIAIDEARAQLLETAEYLEELARQDERKAQPRASGPVGWPIFQPVKNT